MSATATRVLPSLAAGSWISDGDTIADVNPSDLSDTVGEAVRVDRDGVARAVAAAREAQPAWAAVSPQVRADVLDRAASEILARKDELGELLAREEGKTLPEAVGEVARAGQILRFAAGEAVRNRGELVDSVRPGITVEITREPVGVVGLVTPWNFPIAIPAWKAAPALAYGNAVILKPAALVPASAWALVDVLVRSGVPEGVLGLVFGPGSEVGNALVESDGVDAISFTGSVETGRGIAEACARRGIRVQLEMGGKNPLVVLDDADLEVAVDCALQGAYFSTGQRCTASSRLVVTSGIHDRFVERLVERLESVQVGHALEPSTAIGPVVDERQLAPGPRLPGDRTRRGRRARVRRPPARATDARPLPRASAVRRGAQRHADRARGDLRPGRRRDSRRRVRGGARGRQRHDLRAVQRHLHHEPARRRALPSPRRGRDGHGQPADGRRRLPRAVRRTQGVVVRPAGAGKLCARVLHAGQDRVREARVSDEVPPTPEDDARLDEELEETFPASDPTSAWARRPDDETADETDEP